MIEANTPSVSATSKESVALYSSLPSSFGEMQQAKPYRSPVEGNSPVALSSVNPRSVNSPLSFALSFWPELAAASSTVVSPRGKKLRNALLVETIGRSAHAAVACAPRPTFVQEEITQTLRPTESVLYTPEVQLTEAPTEVAPKDGDTKIVVENHENITYTYREIKAKDNPDVLYEGWFKSVTLPDQFPLWGIGGYVKDSNGAWKPAKYLGMINVLVEEGLPGAEALRSIDFNQEPENQSTNDYVGSLIPLLSNRFTGMNPDALGNDKWQKLLSEFEDGNQETAKITFTVNGKTYEWAPGPKGQQGGGSVIYVLNWNNVEPSKENGFVEWYLNPTKDRFRTRFWGVDEKGNILGAIAPEKALKDMPEKEIRLLTLFHTISVLDGTDMSDRGINATVDFYSDAAGKDDPPIMEIERVSQ